MSRLIRVLIEDSSQVCDTSVGRGPCRPTCASVGWSFLSRGTLRAAGCWVRLPGLALAVPGLFVFHSITVCVG